MLPPARLPRLLAGLMLLSACRLDGKNLVNSTGGDAAGSGDSMADRPTKAGPAPPDAARADAAAADAPGADHAAPGDAPADLPSGTDMDLDMGQPHAADAMVGPLPVHCQVGAWTDWTACTKACGGGTQVRTRMITVQPSGGGMACPTLVETGICNDAPCPSDCQLSPFGPWSACSKACGGGTQSRSRTVVKPPMAGGAACGPLTESRPCNTEPPNACGGCSRLTPAPDAACGVCGKAMCSGPERTICKDPARTCAMAGATCGAPPDGCGGRLDCGGCADALTSCTGDFRCECGKPTGLNSPAGDLETGKRAVAPGAQHYATSAGVFDGSGTLLMPFTSGKGFDWHPTRAGRFAFMEHFNPPQPLSVITVYDIVAGQAMRVAAATSSREWHHYLAWKDGSTIALGGEDDCRTVVTVTPATP